LEKPAGTIQVTIVAGNDINPDAAGRASPLLLRFYQLRNVSKFYGADFFSLYENDQEALGTTLVRMDEIMLTPNSQVTRSSKPEGDTQFFGAFAAFRDVGSAQWRGAAAIEAAGTTRIEVRVQGTQLSIASETVPKTPSEDH
jgi:type VI secretion system protein VasD